MEEQDEGKSELPNAFGDDMIEVAPGHWKSLPYLGLLKKIENHLAVLVYNSGRVQ